MTGIDPAFGYSAAAVSVTITGDNFLAKPSGSSLDTTHKAWLDDTALQDVTWVDSHTLHATVPAGLTAGAKTLKVQNAYGRQGSLGNAYTVLIPAGLGGTVAITRTTADVNAAVPVTLTVVNGAGGGTASARITAVTPSVVVSAGSATCTAVSPTLPQTVAGGQSIDFHWTCSATAVGTMTVGAQVSGAEVVSGNALSATAATDSVEIQSAAGLHATLAIQGITPPANVNVAQQLNVTVTVSNTGAGVANITGVTPSPSPASRAFCDAPSPATPVELAGGASRAFTFTCSPTSTGSLSLGAAVAGTNVNTGGALAASATPAALTVQNPAAPFALVGANPTTADVSQPIGVTFVVGAGTGGAGLKNVTVTPSTAGVSCGTVSPSSVPSIGTSNSATFTWSCTAPAAGPVTITGTANATDANSGLPIDPLSPTKGASVTVQTPASLSVDTFTSPATVARNQIADVTLALKNGGGAPANITSVVPGPTGVAGISCTTPQPSVSVGSPHQVGGAGTVTFTWTCTATQGGTYDLGATVTANDDNWTAVNPSPTVATKSLGVTALTAVLTRDPTTNLAVGQDVNVTLTLSNATGAATASVSDIIPSSSGAAVTCPPHPTESPPTATIPGGGSATFHWTCSGAQAGAASLGAAVNTGTVLAPTVAALPVNVVEVPLTAALTSDVTTLVAASPGAVKLTLTLTNGGSATADVTGVTPTVSGILTCANPVSPDASPTAPVIISAGASQAFTWTCNYAGAGAPGDTASLSATAGAIDSVTLQSVAPTSISGAPVTVTLTE